jgi:hypothetical protein
MHKLLRTLALVMAAMLVVFMIGCGDDDDDVDGETVAPDFVSITPAGGEVPANQSFTITFSGAATGVTVNGTPATPPNGKTVTWQGNLPPGAATLAIAWEGGAGATASFTITAPDTTKPTASGGTVKNGDKDVDPEPLNTSGITIEFSEPIAKQSLKLTLEDGTDVGWLPKIDGNKVVFETVKGKELGNETTYKVAGNVSDAAGNQSDIAITFVTKGKE